MNLQDNARSAIVGSDAVGVRGAAFSSWHVRLQCHYILSSFYRLAYLQSRVPRSRCGSKALTICARHYEFGGVLHNLTDPLYFEVLQANANLVQLGYSWSDLAPGDVERSIAKIAHGRAGREWNLVCTDG